MVQKLYQRGPAMWFNRWSDAWKFAWMELLQTFKKRTETLVLRWMWVNAYAGKDRLRRLLGIRKNHTLARRTFLTTTLRSRCRS
jgi:hypothetical protein